MMPPIEPPPSWKNRGDFWVRVYRALFDAEIRESGTRLLEQLRRFIEGSGTRYNLVCSAIEETYRRHLAAYLSATKIVLEGQAGVAGTLAEMIRVDPESGSCPAEVLEIALRNGARYWFSGPFAWTLQELADKDANFRSAVEDETRRLICDCAARVAQSDYETTRGEGGYLFAYDPDKVPLNSATRKIIDEVTKHLRTSRFRQLAKLAQERIVAAELLCASEFPHAAISLADVQEMWANVGRCLGQLRLSHIAASLARGDINESWIRVFYPRADSSVEHLVSAADAIPAVREYEQQIRALLAFEQFRTGKVLWHKYLSWFKKNLQSLREQISVTRPLAAPAADEDVAGSPTGVLPGSTDLTALESKCRKLVAFFAADTQPMLDAIRWASQEYALGQSPERTSEISRRLHASVLMNVDEVLYGPGERIPGEMIEKLRDFRRDVVEIVGRDGREELGEQLKGRRVSDLPTRSLIKVESAPQGDMATMKITDIVRPGYWHPGSQRVIHPARVNLGW